MEQMERAFSYGKIPTRFGRWNLKLNMRSNLTVSFLRVFLSLSLNYATVLNHSMSLTWSVAGAVPHYLRLMRP